MDERTPIFIVGIGRCGTSTTARILHTQLGVSMGSRFREPDAGNPQGYWEDLDFRDINQLVMTQTWGGLHLFVRSLKTLIDARIAAGRPWGVKDPRLCYLLPYYLMFCPDARIVWCVRDHAQVIESLTQRFGCSLEVATPEVARRENLVDSLLTDRADLVLDFSKRRTDEELATFLKSLVRAVAVAAV